MAFHSQQLPRIFENVGLLLCVHGLSRHQLLIYIYRIILYLSVCLSVYLSVCVSIYLSFFIYLLSLRLSIYLPIFLFPAADLPI